MWCFFIGDVVITHSAFPERKGPEERGPSFPMKIYDPFQGSERSSGFMTTFQFYLAVIIFCLTYVGIMSEKFPRTICALVGGGAMIYAGYVTQSEAFERFIDWNTLGLLAGMMILISVVKKSGFFRVLALWAMKESKGSPRELLVLLSCVTAVGASLIDSVTAALLIAPMTISLCRMLKISPVPVLVSEILMCNVGGTALMIGNPPNVMIGSATHLDFNDFLINLAPVVVITIVATLIGILFISVRSCRMDTFPRNRSMPLILCPPWKTR